MQRLEQPLKGLRPLEHVLDPLLVALGLLRLLAEEVKAKRAPGVETILKVESVPPGEGDEVVGSGLVGRTRELDLALGFEVVETKDT